MKTIFVCVVFVLTYLPGKCQTAIDSLLPAGPSFVKLFGEVKIIDSQYFLITHLITEKNDNIIVQKARCFTEWSHRTGFCAGTVYIQRAVRNVYVNESTDALGSPSYFADWDKSLVLDKTHPALDTILLDNFIPFEKGEYRIIATVRYYYKGNSYTAESGFIEFIIPFPPPRSIYN